MLWKNKKKTDMNMLTLNVEVIQPSMEHVEKAKSSGVASSISEGDIYSYSAQLISFEIKSISKEVN